MPGAEASGRSACSVSSGLMNSSYSKMGGGSGRVNNAELVYAAMHQFQQAITLY